MSARMIFFLAMACGLIAANIYYAQPLAGVIGFDLNFAPQTIGFVVTLTQIGYGVALLLVVPLSDLMENRKLIIFMLSAAACGLLSLATSSNPILFLASSFLVGLGSAAMQVIVPYAAHMTSESERGRVVGYVMSGLLLGMMLARPIASSITQFFIWRTVFFLAFLFMVALIILLWIYLPNRQPATGAKYSLLLASMWLLMKSTPVLRRRSIYHACMFGAFSLFWTTAPLYLAGPIFNFSQGCIAIFSFAGAAGAVAAPIAGKLADRGWTTIGTLLSMLGVAFSFLITQVDTKGSILSLVLLFIAALVLDFCVSFHMIISQRQIFLLNPKYRGRFNGIYISTIFLGGAVGSALGGWAYTFGHWSCAAWIGFIFPIFSISYFASERYLLK